jgi:hypothetical protein
MSNPEGNNKAPDQFEQWRGLRDTYLDAWSKAMIEGVNTEAYAKATGAVLDAYLTASMPFREAVEKAMLQALQQLSMPTRADFIGLAERLTNIEMRLDDMDSKLDHIEQMLARSASSSTPPAPPKPGAKKGAR